jgi:hypothetical protein
VTYSTLGDAVLKTGLILVLMEKGLQTKVGNTQEKEQLEDNITLFFLKKFYSGCVSKNSYGWAAGRHACKGMAKTRSSRIRSKP